MRKTMVAFAGAAALALGSAAGAAVTVTGSTGLNNPDPAAVGSIQTVGTTTTINFGQNPASSPSFTSSFSFSNDIVGLYTIVVGSSDPGITFTSGTLTGAGGSFNLAPASVGSFSLLTLGATTLASGMYTLTFAGTNPVPGGSYDGTLMINQVSGVPEPGTWGMMLLGFGAMGLVVRRRRHPALAQIA